MPDQAVASEQSPKLIVAMGASAGAIEAWQEFFEAVPEGTGIAYILVLHLDPSRTSHIAEILQSSAEHVTITQAHGSIVLEPNYAYVIAPNSKLHLEGGKLEVEPLAEHEIRSGLVDYLFASLADVAGPRAAGVVLSGAGHDGTEGLRRIREVGGLTIVQDPVTATSRSMPQSAIDAAVVDAVLTPAMIVKALVDFASEGHRPERPRQTGRGTGELTSGGFERILQRLGELAGVDFDDYKTGTLQRRARRRMERLRADDWAAYADLLADDPAELDALYQDVLIGVTEFFRDPPMWERLAEELPALFEEHGDSPLRAWVVGCATGEEAYSLAMLLLETAPVKSHSRIQVYATDLNNRALAIARRGVYSGDALANVSTERRERFFNQHNGHLQIERGVRDCVTFAPHNALGDAPFSRMDVVTCRNVLIYLHPQGHDMLLRRLHFALRPRGLLALGRAETLGRQARLFQPESESHAIFRARETKHREPFQIKSRGGERRGPDLPVPPATRDTEQLRDTRADRRIEQFVLRERTPACVVITTRFEIQHFYGRTQDYLVTPTGESRQDLLSWVRPGFYIPLRSVLNQSVDNGERLETEGQIERDGESHRVRCTVEPLPANVGTTDLLLVTFNDLARSALRRVDASAGHEPLVRELEQELADTRRELQTTIEHLESAGEEHHASNEELQSLNEELQSSNEELEASKEELQALNEEISTINRELEEKNFDLREANSDLNALFVSTGVPTVFLDPALRIRRFTSAATDLMHLVQSDVGRSVEQVKERFEDGSTFARARRVLDTQEPDSDEVVIEDGRIYLRNILPYRMDDADVAGVCITFADVTAQKRAAQVSEAARAYAEEIIETARTPMLVLDGTLQVTSANASFRDVFDEDDTVLGRKLADLRGRLWHDNALTEAVRTVLSSGVDVSDLEISGPDRAILSNIRRVDREGLSFGVLVSFEDVTHHRLAAVQSQVRAEELRQDARRKDEWIAMLGHELRNPVGAISNAVQLLKLSPRTAEQQAGAVAILERQVRHIAGMLDHLLDAARIISGKLSVDRSPVDLAEVCGWAVEGVRTALDGRGQELSLTLPPTATVWVAGDALRLTEVVTNLLTNANKYTQRGGHIALAVEVDDEWTTLRVSDDGIGIPEALQSQIFEIFTQGPRSLGRGERGLGLGLPLVRTLAELHGGSVEVASAGEGLGSEFRVRLPRCPAPDLADAAGNEARSEPRSSRRRVLVVDDEADVADSLKELLDTQGHECLATGDAESALTVIRTFNPEVAILDLGLPGADGYELAEQIHRERPDIRLFAMTGYQRNAERLESAGFEGYLRKPVDVARLSELLGDADDR